MATQYKPGSAGQPDITYTPDHAQYVARTKRRQEAENLAKLLPAGFPLRVASDLAWDGKTVSEHYQWSYNLDDSELSQLDEALRHFQRLNKPLGFIDQQSFPLPTLHATLRDISKEIHLGHGFKVVRGIPVRRYSHEENIIIYAGIASHVAPARGRQDNLFHGEPADVVLGHIKNMNNQLGTGKIGSPAYTSEAQVFHTDTGDVVALFALSIAAKGGQSYLSSNWKVYNELASTRPDLIETLREPWPAEEFGKLDRPYTARPILYHQTGTNTTPERLIMQYTRRSFTGYSQVSRSASIPPITEAQAEALDALHFTAERYRISLDFQEGDIQFINNLSTFHAREAFKDTPEQQRHLVRLWLRDPEYAWETPDALRERWARIYDGVTPEKSILPVEPVIRSTNTVAAVGK
ncbi:putative TauD/TfdA-like domain-containing protein [Seiridium unicorne]|uniref:TauD/TfdA-like domain-containing protein n=1 Tax=Seiridium unicorne TaxID=138068 RepID=A0ABR2UV11_9PEZI